MTALYRCDRQAEALAVYRRLRERLDRELGLQPSEELRELERTILTRMLELPAAVAGTAPELPPPSPEPGPSADERKLVTVVLPTWWGRRLSEPSGCRARRGS